MLRLPHVGVSVGLQPIQVRLETHES
jgi:hypothetical protein